MYSNSQRVLCYNEFRVTVMLTDKSRYTIWSFETKKRRENVNEQEFSYRFPLNLFQNTEI